MSMLKKAGVGMLIALFITGCSSYAPLKTSPYSPNVLKKIKVKIYKRGVKVMLEGTKPPAYTAFRLISPWRVVVDLPNTYVKFLKKRVIQLDKGIVKKVKIRQVGKNGRLELITDNIIPAFNVKRDDNMLKVVVTRGVIKKKRAQAEGEESEELEGEEIVEEEAGLEEEELLPEEELITEVEEEAPEEVSLEEIPEEVVEEEVPPEEITPEEKPAKEVEEKLPEEVVEKKAPEEITEEVVSEVAPEVVTKEVPVTAEAAPIEVTAPSEVTPPVVEAVAPEEVTPPVVEEVVPEIPEKASKIVDIVSSTVEDETLIELVGNGSIGDYTAFKLDNPPRLVVDIMEVGNLYPSTTVDINTSLVKRLRLGQHPDKVRFVFDVATPEVPRYEIERKENKLVVTFSPMVPPAVAAEIEKPEIEIKKVEIPREVPPPQVKPQPTPVKKVVPPAPPFEVTPELIAVKKYKGMKISLEFKDADIRDILRLIAEVSKLNIIVTDDVKGTMTIRMKNVPWDQALDVILQTNKLGMIRVGNVVRISPIDRLRKEEEERLEYMEKTRKKEPLVTRLIPVNYASASELASRIKTLLTDRGSVQTDERTNTIIVKDVKRVVEESEKLVRTLDMQTPQVLIEARIVEASTSFTRELGVQWGGRFSASPRYGTATGLYFPNTIGVSGFTDIGGRTDARDIGSEEIPNFVVNLPASAGLGIGGGIGFIFGTLNNSAILDLRLSAMEQRGEGKVISSPRIVTLDNREAEIKQGVSIPFETVSQAGTQTQFIDAVLSLKVTPHVTADRTIIMKVKAEKNAPNTTLRSAGGVPSIDRKEAITEILVSDGETAVIGGIYTITKSKSVAGLPWFSRIPLIGWLFRKTTYTDETKELIVFITPRIIVRE